MIDILSDLMLLLVPGAPLLLAFLALRSRLSMPCLVALLPAIVLVTILVSMPVNFSIKIPWLLLGTGLAIDAMSRLFLTMSVLLWIVASLYLYRPSRHVVSHRFTTLFLLTMAGNLGVILSTELVGFFTFLTLMSYGFYGLLVDSGDESIRKSGRIYLGFMILADLMLFEALLIAAATTDDLSFAAVQQEISVSSSSDLYLSVVLLGFAAKAGIWPLHFWLSAAFRLSRPAVALLIIGVPIAMGLFGTLRWLPLGEIHSPVLGIIIKSLGAAAMLYAILFAMLQAQLKTLPAYIVVFFTGLYAVALGMGLADPALWRQYENPLHFFIILMVISLSVLVGIITWLETKYHYLVGHEKLTDKLNFKLEQLNRIVANYLTLMRTQTLPQMLTTGLLKADCLRQVSNWYSLLWQRLLDSSERFLQSWSIAITLFILLSIVVALISSSLWLQY